MELATERHDCEAGFGDRFAGNSSAMPAKGKGSVYRSDPFAYDTLGMAEKQSETTSIQGTVGRITYQHPETHYTVARLDEQDGGGITIVGTVFPARAARWQVAGALPPNPYHAAGARHHPAEP